MTKSWKTLGLIGCAGFLITKGLSAALLLYSIMFFNAFMVLFVTMLIMGDALGKTTLN
jgi:hypothetical protein